MSVGDQLLYLLYASASKPLSHKALIYSIFVVMLLCDGRSTHVQVCSGNFKLNKNKEIF